MTTIITVRDDVPVMENRLGIRWCPVKTEKGFGIGHFEMEGQAFGTDEESMLVESSLDWNYYAPEYEIIENTEQTGILRLYGISSKIRFDIRVKMENNSHVIAFDYDMEPLLPVYKRVYAPVPFETDNMAFLKYPYEDTITSRNLRSFEIETDYARVPFIFGKDGNGNFLGAGYYLTDAFADGRIGFDRNREAFQIWAQFRGMAKENDIQLAKYPSPDNIRFTDLGAGIQRATRKFRFLVSVGKTQYDVFRDYMDKCGYDFTAFFYHTAEHYEADWIDIFKNARYFDGKGYSLKISTDTGDMDLISPHGNYGTIIAVPCQMSNCIILYNYWKRHPGEEWARTRAFEMADFFVERQLPNGMVPSYNADLGDIPQGIDMETGSNPYAGGGAVGMLEESQGASGILRFYQMVKEQEGTAKQAWYDSGVKLAEWILSCMDSEGRLGRNYTYDGKPDIYCYAMGTVLDPLNQIAGITGDVRFEDARDRLEAYVWSTYIAEDNFTNLAGDSLSWSGSEGIEDNDAIGLLGLIRYCAGRHAQTHEKKYLDTAKDLFVYLWACNCPVDLEGFTHPTRALMREQDFYCCFDSLLCISFVSDGLPYIAKETGDPAFMQFYAIAMQSFLALQEKHDRFHGMHIGLEADVDGLSPIDVVAEGKHFYTSMGFGPGVLFSMLSPMHYWYAGGKDWGVGLDYRVEFDFASMQDVPYVKAGTSVIRQVTMDRERNILKIWCYDLEKTDVDVEIKWNGNWSMEQSIVYYGHEKGTAAQFYQEDTQSLRVPVRNVMTPSKLIQIRLKEGK